MHPFDALTSETPPSPAVDDTSFFLSPFPLQTIPAVGNVDAHNPNSLICIIPANLPGPMQVCNSGHVISSFPSAIIPIISKSSTFSLF